MYSFVEHSSFHKKFPDFNNCVITDLVSNVYRLDYWTYFIENLSNKEPRITII